MAEEIKIFQNDAELFQTAAAFIIEEAAKAIQRNGRFCWVLSGGRTPEKLFQLLAQPDYASKIDWSHTFVFWGDERYVDVDDKLNNARMAKELLLDKVSIPAGNIFRMPVSPSPAEAAFDYQQEISAFFKGAEPSFDLIMLGLGDNAHTASLFPHTAILHERDRWVKEVYVEEQDLYRISMTAPLINLAQNIVFLLTGKEKADALYAVLHASYNPELYPAQLIRPAKGKLFWLIDQPAASRIHPES